jgi:hypothetical protein
MTVCHFDRFDKSQRQAPGETLVPSACEAFFFILRVTSAKTSTHSDRARSSFLGSGAPAIFPRFATIA